MILAVQQDLSSGLNQGGRRKSLFKANVSVLYQITKSFNPVTTIKLLFAFSTDIEFRYTISGKKVELVLRIFSKLKHNDYNELPVATLKRYLLLLA